MFVLNEAGSQLGLWEFSKIGWVDGMRVSDVMLIEIWRSGDLASLLLKAVQIWLFKNLGIQALCGSLDSDEPRADHCIIQTCSQWIYIAVIITISQISQTDRRGDMSYSPHRSPVKYCRYLSHTHNWFLCGNVSRLNKYSIAHSLSVIRLDTTSPSSFKKANKNQNNQILIWINQILEAITSALAVILKC